MDGGVAVSWHSELVPPPLTPWNVASDLLDAWRLYRKAQLPLRERVAFLTLRLIQRVSYGVGWLDGLRTSSESRRRLDRA
jgi:hypothetical protein